MAVVAVPQRLYESPGGNQVDGLPPASSLEKHTKFNISAHNNGRKLDVIGAKILILRFFTEILWKEFISHRT